jgi:phage baseplate assembly protein W
VGRGVQRLAVVTQHLALPLRLTPGGALATVAEDSVEEITQSVAVILRTQPGDRLTEPEFGLADPAFAELPPQALLSAIEPWEPRATVEIVEQVLTAQGLRRTRLSLSAEQEG